ncbi:VWA domain-containing protein [Peribacillus frigoritolerans]|uniref:VWA domain-containing protein n=1 Tax=Peribacillus frigoritolerans TaxID=450367 RepID=UPI0037CBDBAA
MAASMEDILQEKAGEYSGTAYNEAVVHRAMDEQNFQDKDSFQVYDSLLKLMGEGPNYQEYYDFVESFNGNIETKVTEAPESMKLENGKEVNGTANISILLDASGSMAQMIGDKTKMDLAKEAINKFVASMPEGSNVSLRIYGHKGSNDDSDKELSCSSTEMVYDLKPYNKSDFASSLGEFNPTGWTPIAKAISEAKTDFQKANKPGQNIIYVVSDGIETCDGDPAKEAKELHDSNIKAVVNIIGFDVDSAGQKQLLSVAEAGGGKFETVNSAEDFKQVLERERTRLYNEWSAWSANNYNEVMSEQGNKNVELINSKGAFAKLAFDEKVRMDLAANYLLSKEQISQEVRSEVSSLIQQRSNISEEYRKKYDELMKSVNSQGQSLRDDISDKGDEMKDKYKN